MRLLAILLTALLCTGTAMPAFAATPQLGLHVAPCVKGKVKAAALCGTFGVYEDRTGRTGRTIALNVVVLKAPHPNGRAIAEIAGGPGEAATDFAGDIADGNFGGARKTMREHFDIILVDNRGMGKSNPFGCNFTPVSDPKAYFAQDFPSAAVAACAARSAKTHAIKFYNTTPAVDDLDDVRAALGYKKISLSAGSYGTLFAMVFLRRHSEHVESVVLDGVTAPGFQTVMGSPDGAQTALNDLFSRCRASAACAKTFPHFGEHFAAVLRRFDRGPLSVPVQNVATKHVQNVQLSKEVFVDQVRHFLYAPFTASYLPYIIDRAYAGDYAPLARAVQTAVLGFSQGQDMGSNLAYACADIMPFITAAQIRYAQTQTFTGDLRIRAEQQACRIWHVRPMPRSFNEPVRSTIPVFMILGSDDPATPASYGLAALRYLPNGAAVVVQGGGHGADTPCTDRLFIRFVRTASIGGVKNSRCSGSFSAPPFATSMKGWPQ